MEEFKIVIATDFSPTPGGRWQELGPNSGEEFYNKVLLPKYEEAVEREEKLSIYLDGVRSYPSSFLDQSFGVLARTYGPKNVDARVVLHAEVFRWVVDYIKKEIWFKDSSKH